jgi:hypothetical protein
MGSEGSGGCSEVRRVLKASAFPEGRASVLLVATAVTTRERPTLLGTEESQSQGSRTRSPCSRLGRASKLTLTKACWVWQKTLALLPPQTHPLSFL